MGEISTMVDALTNEQLEEFREAFDLHDEDGIGSIKTSALGPVMRALGQHLSEDQLQQMVDEIDKDSSGEVSFQQFLLLQARRMETGESDEDVMVLQAFKIYDKDGDGFLSVATVRHIFGTLAGLDEKSVNELVDMAAKHKTGMI